VAADTGPIPRVSGKTSAEKQRADLAVVAFPLAWRLRARIGGAIKTVVAAAPWPLFMVLAVQAGLSLRLVWSTTAFDDEGLYLRAGHLELAHWLYGTAVPPFAVWFSGAPVVYPPLGALADAAGGLAGARLLSLAFMMAATVLLYATAARLLNRKAAVLAAGLFVVVGPTQDVGAFATYDAMAVFLLALATWLAVRARGWVSEPLLIAAALVMALADAAKYASGLWNPVIIAVAALSAERGNWLRRAFRGARMTAYAAAAVAVALFRFGGHLYIQGIMFTTLARASSNTPVFAVLRLAATYVGMLVVLALIGTKASSALGRRAQVLCAVLTAAAVLAPLEEARIHTSTSLYKHVVFGAWFGAIAAGYAVARATEVNAVKGWRIGPAVTALLGVIGFGQATGMFGFWPDTAPLVASLTQQMASYPGPVFIQSGSEFAPNVLNYYLLRQDAEAKTGYVSAEYAPAAVAASAIRSHYYAVVATDHTPGAGHDYAVLDDALRRTAGYRMVTSIPWRDASTSGRFEVWRDEQAAGR
jgi:hypothetical protein